MASCPCRARTTAKPSAEPRTLLPLLILGNRSPNPKKIPSPPKRRRSPLHPIYLNLSPLPAPPPPPQEWPSKAVSPAADRPLPSPIARRHTTRRLPLSRVAAPSIPPLFRFADAKPGPATPDPPPRPPPSRRWRTSSLRLTRLHRWHRPLARVRLGNQMRAFGLVTR